MTRLAEAEERYRLTLLATNDALWDWDLISGVVVRGSVFESDYGWPIATMEGDRDWWSDRIHPEDRDRVLASNAEAIASGERWVCEYRLRRGDGSYADVEDRGFVIRDATGRAARFVGALADVSARKAAERALAQTQEKWRLAQQLTGVGVWEADLRDGSVVWSPEMFRLYGRDEALGSPTPDEFAALLHPDDRDRVMSLDGVEQGKESFENEFRIRHGDGSWRWVLSRAKVVSWDDDGKPVGTLGTNVDITSRKADAATLAASEERLRLAFDVGGIGAWDIDLISGAVTESPVISEMFGLPAGQTNRHVDETRARIHPDDLNRVDTAVADAIRSGEVYQIEHRILRPDGKTIWLAVRGRALRDEAGKPVRAVGVTREITAERLAKEELAASEAQFRVTAETMPGMLFVTSPEGKNSYVNEAFRHFTGRTTEALLGDGWTETLHPDDAERGWAIWNAAVASGKAYSAEYRFRRHDGVWRWHAVRALPVTDEAGRVLQWVGCCIDIHERRVGEEELERRITEALAERRLWAEVVEANDAMICACDSDLRLLAINRAHAAEWERRYATVPKAGDRLADLLAHHPKAHARIRSVWERALAGETLVTVSGDGAAEHDRRWFETKSSPLRNAAGEVIGAVHVTADVTDRLLQQEALARHRSELARANRQLTEEIARREATHAALVQAQKLEALGQLVSGVAHDFNNVLQAVAGGYHLIEKRSSDPQTAEIARHGAASAQRGSNLVKQLLAFARQQEIRPRAVDLCRLLDEAEALIQRSLTSSIRLTIDCPSDVPLVLADPTLLETAIINLAVNARDAMPDGGSLTITTRACPADDADRPAELEDAPAVVLSVIDTGCGMSAEVLQRVIEPFFTTKGPGKGTGLGLASVHGFARQSNGALRIDSREAAGTTVRIYLREAARDEDKAVAGDGRQSPAMRAGSILLIDDDHDVRSTTAMMIADMGHHVLEAGDRTGAIMAIDQHAIDLVISDVIMPDVDGITLAAELRQRCPDVPVLFVTGHAERARLKGERILEKPFTPAQLAQEIAAVLPGGGPV